jgi:tetratricopeptide (TPR) repeat protein
MRSPRAWLGCAVALRANRHYEDALDTEAKALALDLENPSGWLSRSRTPTLISRYEEALNAVEWTIHLNPMVDEDWSAWERKQCLLSRLGRSSEAEEAMKRVRELLEIAAGALPTEDNATLSPAQRQSLVDKIYCDEGSPEDQELRNCGWQSFSARSAKDSSLRWKRWRGLSEQSAALGAGVRRWVPG